MAEPVFCFTCKKRIENVFKSFCCYTIHSNDLIYPEERCFCSRKCWSDFLEKEVLTIKKKLRIFGNNYENKYKNIREPINELKKTYKIYELYGKPMIRLNNLILQKFNFDIGEKVVVTYGLNKIIIEKKLECSKLMKGGVVQNGKRNSKCYES
ncbi:hypothetical protein HYW76_00230 [Candidatus Pacearchaeota archaeon]|nr:hypothetical protein [Candidatus Pacearchaeota archaeon]